MSSGSSTKTISGSSSITWFPANSSLLAVWQRGRRNSWTFPWSPLTMFRLLVREGLRTSSVMCARRGGRDGRHTGFRKFWSYIGNRFQHETVSKAVEGVTIGGILCGGNCWLFDLQCVECRWMGKGTHWVQSSLAPYRQPPCSASAQLQLQKRHPC